MHEDQMVLLSSSVIHQCLRKPMPQQTKSRGTSTFLPSITPYFCVSLHIITLFLFDQALSQLAQLYFCLGSLTRVPDPALQKGVFCLFFLFSAKCQSNRCRAHCCLCRVAGDRVKKEVQGSIPCPRSAGMEGKCTSAPLTRMQPPSGILQRKRSLTLVF